MDLIQDANLIVDCDEILVNISPLWVKKLYALKAELNEYIDLDQFDKFIDNFDELNEYVIRRPVFYLTDWLKRKEIKELPKDIVDKIMGVYTEDKDFYYDLPLNKMAVSLNKFSRHPSVKKVYVVTRCSSTINFKGKEELIKTLFPMTKLEIITLKIGEKKSDFIKHIDIKNGFIFEDELSNIMDYLNSGVCHCNFYIPKLGYNYPTKDLMALASEKEICISYY